MKKRNLLVPFFLVLSFTLMDQLVNAQTCFAGEVWSCYKVTSHVISVCACVDSSSAFAQQCSNDQVLACRLDPHCNWICQCLETSKVASWLSHGRDCNKGGGGGGHNPHWHWRSAENQENLQYETLIEGVYPNPVFNTATIAFSLSRSQRVSLQVFDMNGRLISTIADHAFKKGENELLWNADEISDGIYFLRLVAGEVVQTEKIMIAK